MILVLCHPLEDAEFHIIFALAFHIKEVLDGYAPLQKLEIVVHIHSINKNRGCGGIIRRYTQNR